MAARTLNRVSPAPVATPGSNGYPVPMSQIIRARPEDAAAFSMIALAAKGSWGYPARWLERWRVELTITPEFIATHETWVAMNQGHATGFHALVIRHGVLWLEHLWIEPAHMKRGLGRALFQHAVERGRSLGFTNLEIESDPHAISFYIRMGASRTGSSVISTGGETRELPRLVFPIT